MSASRTITAWAIQRGSTNLLDGHRTYLDGDPVCASRTRLFRKPRGGSGLCKAALQLHQI